MATSVNSRKFILPNWQLTILHFGKLRIKNVLIIMKFSIVTAQVVRFRPHFHDLFTSGTCCLINLKSLRIIEPENLPAIKCHKFHISHQTSKIWKFSLSFSHLPSLSMILCSWAFCPALALNPKITKWTLSFHSSFLAIFQLDHTIQIHWWSCLWAAAQLPWISFSRFYSSTTTMLLQPTCCRSSCFFQISKATALSTLLPRSTICSLSCFFQTRPTLPIRLWQCWCFQ